MGLAAHLLETYENKPTHNPSYPTPVRPPFRPFRPFLPPQPELRSTMNPDESWMSSHGFPPSTGGPSRFTQWSEEKIAQLQTRLARKLGPEYVTQRQGPAGGGKLSYIEGWKVINLANEVFGFNGWSTSIQSLTTDYVDTNDQGRTNVCITAIVRITLQDGAYHEDVGCGQAENIKGKGSAIDKAKKEAVTDATKRALKAFGNVLGNCLYDKDYTKEVVKMRVPPAKFNHSELERRPEFTDMGAGPSRPAAIPPHMATGGKPPIPASAAGPYRSNERESPAPETPLRPIHEIREGDVIMDESFDAEFLNFADGSVLETTDRSTVLTSLKPPHVPAPQPVRGMQPPSRIEQPVYQHRHRPEPPRTEALLSDPPLAALLSPTKPVDGGNQSGSGNSSDTTVEEMKPRPVGGFNYTNGLNRSTSAGSSAGQSARMAAILGSTVQNAPPSRTESPRIPSGGIDVAAVRAAAIMRTNGERTDLIEGRASPVVGESGLYGGFASARGMKRNVSGEEAKNVSPTKANAPGLVPPHVQRSGPRRALGELPIPSEMQGPDDWGAKRQRGF